VLCMDVGMYGWCSSSMHVWRVLRWWHQTLHLEASIAIASQYSNQRNIHAVLAHVARWCGLDSPGDFSPGPSGFWPRSSHSPQASAFSVFALVSLSPTFAHVLYTKMHAHTNTWMLMCFMCIQGHVFHL
jgi:hypothetical protein